MAFGDWSCHLCINSIARMWSQASKISWDYIPVKNFFYSSSWTERWLLFIFKLLTKRLVLLQWLTECLLLLIFKVLTKSLLHLIFQWLTECLLICKTGLVANSFCSKKRADESYNTWCQGPSGGKVYFPRIWGRKYCAQGLCYVLYTQGNFLFVTIYNTLLYNKCTNTCVQYVAEL
jgi:hypothetical protein